MKTTLEIAKELGVEKYVVASVIATTKILPIHIECGKNFFSEAQKNQIIQILQQELKIPLEKKEIVNTEYYEEIYHVYESKINYENTIS